MIRKRNQNVNSSTEKPVDELTFPPNFNTYKEEAIYVLNVLEKQGIDIYSENNFPGMYLKGVKKPEVTQTLKSKILSTSKQVNNNDSQELKNINNLFERLKNNK